MNNVICSHCLLETDGGKALCCLCFPPMLQKKREQLPAFPEELMTACVLASHTMCLVKHSRDDLYFIVVYELSSFLGGEKRVNKKSWFKKQLSAKEDGNLPGMQR